MSERARRNTLLLLGLAILATALLATGLPQLELKPGLPFPTFEDAPALAGPEQANPGLSFEIKTFVTLGVLLAALLLYLAYKFFTGMPWRDVLDPVLITAFIVLAMAILILGMFRGPVQIEMFPMETVTPEPTPVPVPLGPVPGGLTWLVALVLALSAALLGLAILHQATRPKPARNPLEWEAEKAIQDLMAGLDFRSAILNCYRQMSQALQKEQGLELERGMTAREFEAQLQAHGLPPEPVHRLTALFEAVRYGHWQPGSDDERQAIACLQEIIAYSQQTGQAG